MILSQDDLQKVSSILLEGTAAPEVGDKMNEIKFSSIYDLDKENVEVGETDLIDDLWDSVSEDDLDKQFESLFESDEDIDEGAVDAVDAVDAADTTVDVVVESEGVAATENFDKVLAESMDAIANDVPDDATIDSWLLEADESISDALALLENEIDQDLDDSTFDLLEAEIDGGSDIIVVDEVPDEDIEDEDDIEEISSAAEVEDEVNQCPNIEDEFAQNEDEVEKEIEKKLDAATEAVEDEAYMEDDSAEDAAILQEIDAFLEDTRFTDLLESDEDKDEDGIPDVEEDHGELEDGFVGNHEDAEAASRKDEDCDCSCDDEDSDDSEDEDDFDDDSEEDDFDDDSEDETEDDEDEDDSEDDEDEDDEDDDETDDEADEDEDEADDDEEELTLDGGD